MMFPHCIHYIIRNFCCKTLYISITFHPFQLLSTIQNGINDHFSLVFTSIVNHNNELMYKYYSQSTLSSDNSQTHHISISIPIL